MVLKKACCCIDLAVGVEILGWLGIISGMIHMTNTQTQSYPGIINKNEKAEFIGCIIQIIICACLVSGVRMKNKALLLPWLILNLIGLVVINLFICGQVSDLTRKKDLTRLLIIDFMVGYLWLIVLSLYNNFDHQVKRITVVYNNFDNTRLIHPEQFGVENHV